MKMDYLENVDNSYPEFNIIRLSDFTIEEAKKLQKIIRVDLLTNHNQIEFSKLDFIYPINCNLTFKIAVDDVALYKIKDSDNSFICELTEPEFAKMIDSIEPFCKRLLGYQWLLDLYCETDILLSPNGKWSGI